MLFEVQSWPCKTPFRILRMAIPAHFLGVSFKQFGLFDNSEGIRKKAFVGGVFGVSAVIGMGEIPRRFAPRNDIGASHGSLVVGPPLHPGIRRYAATLGMGQGIAWHAARRYAAPLGMGHRMTRGIAFQSRIASRCRRGVALLPAFR